MRHILLVALLATLAACAKEVPLESLVERQGIYYEVNSQKPFSGAGVDYYSDGQLSRKEYQNGERHGVSETYYRNGQLEEKRTKKNGERHGVSETYYRNGQLSSTGTYNNGEPHGLHEDYHENGQLSRSGTYNNGKRHGLHESYYKNGQLSRSGTYGEQHWTEESYCEDGRLWLKETYRNGQIWSKETYRNGQSLGIRHGPFDLFDKDGHIIWEEDICGFWS